MTPQQIEQLAFEAYPIGRDDISNYERGIYLSALIKASELLYTEEQMKQIWENAFHGESFEECLQSLKQQ